MLVSLRNEDRFALTAMGPNVGIDDTFDAGINTTGSNNSSTDGQWMVVVFDELLADDGDVLGKSNHWAVSSRCVTWRQSKSATGSGATTTPTELKIPPKLRWPALPYVSLTPNA